MISEETVPLGFEAVQGQKQKINTAIKNPPGAGGRGAVGWLVGWRVGWLVAWLVGCSAGRLALWLPGWLFGWLVGLLAGW